MNPFILIGSSSSVEKFETNFDKARLDPKNLKAPINYKRGTEKKFKEQAFFVEGEYNIPIEVHNAISSVAIKDNAVFYYANNFLGNISQKVNCLVHTHTLFKRKLIQSYF